MKQKKTIISLVFLLLLLLFSGCTGSTKGNLKPVSQWPPEKSNEKNSVCLIVTVEEILFGKENEVDDVTCQIITDNIVKTYSESNLFTEVKTGLNETDFQAEVKIIHLTRRNTVATCISVFTLVLIPYRLTREYIVRTNIRDMEENILVEFEKSEVKKEWCQFFLTFVNLFVESDVIEILNDLNRATIIEAHAQGII